MATITTQVATTPTPVATPRPPAALVITPVPTPVADEADVEERSGVAPWVYYFPTKWVPDVDEWSEDFRWQDPLPTLEPPLEWGENTWRTPYPTFEGYRDRPFIRAYDRPYETLSRQVEEDMYEIFGTHQQIQAEWAVMESTADMSGLLPYITGNLEAWVRDFVELDLHGQNVRAQATPYVHEIIAMTIFGDRAEVLQVYRGAEANYYDATTGELRYGLPPSEREPGRNVLYSYAQWQRIDGRWTETSATFSADSELSPVEWLAERSPPLVPYIAIWESALAQQAAARAGAR